MTEQTRTHTEERVYAPLDFSMKPAKIQDYSLDPFGRFWVTKKLSPEELEKACDRVSAELYCSEYVN